MWASCLSVCLHLQRRSAISTSNSEFGIFFRSLSVILSSFSCTRVYLCDALHRKRIRSGRRLSNSVQRRPGRCGPATTADGKNSERSNSNSSHSGKWLGVLSRRHFLMKCTQSFAGAPTHTHTHALNAVNFRLWRNKKCFLCCCSCIWRYELSLRRPVVVSSFNSI